MKQKVLLLMVLALGMAEMSFSKRYELMLPSNDSPIVIKKTKQVENGGFIWYQLKRGNHYGAQNENGEYIIPIKYDEIHFMSSSKESTCFFNNSSVI